jgi:trehalose-6-phosphate synthase
MMNITMDLLCSIAQFNFCMLVIYLQEGDVVWCHDYHLMFLPKCLKNMDSHMKVGWFLHTPFPSSEIFRTLPMRSELLRAVLTADLIGCVECFFFLLLSITQ